MKVFIAALLCFLASLLAIVPDPTLRLPAELRELVSHLVPALLVYVMAEALQWRREQAEEEQALAHIVSAKENRPAASVKQKNLQREYNELLEEKEELQTALRDAEKRLKEARALPGSAVKREAQVDAELVNLLSLLQEKGRLVDFLMDDITSYPDAQVGAASRVVHQGCAAVLRDYFEIAPVQAGQEGGQLELRHDYDPTRYRLVGKVGGAAPFRGTLLHHGWIVNRISLPRVVKSGESLEQHRVIAPAEVELS